MVEDVNWKDYVDSRFVDTAKAVEIAQSSAEKAVDKSDAATDKRFENLDKRHDDLTRIVAELLPKGDYRVQYSALTDRISAIEARLSREQGGHTQIQDTRQSTRWIVSTLLAGLAVVASIVAIVVVVIHH
jgi:hypothetical protein